MFLYICKNIIKTLNRSVSNRYFLLSAFFLFYVTVIMVHTQLWTKQSNVRTNTKYTSHVNSF